MHAPWGRGVVRRREVLGVAVVPNGHVTMPPSPSDLQIRAVEQGEQVVEQTSAFIRHEPDHVHGEALVDEDVRLAGDRVVEDYGVDGASELAVAIVDAVFGVLRVEVVSKTAEVMHGTEAS